VMDVCKFNTVKAKDFDEAILVVQVWVGMFEIRDVLLDRRSSVNIISKSLWMKLKLRKPQPTSFVVCMDNRHNV
jgi:hypothetical protein